MARRGFVPAALPVPDLFAAHSEKLAENVPLQLPLFPEPGDILRLKHRRTLLTGNGFPLFLRLSGFRSGELLFQLGDLFPERPDRGFDLFPHQPAKLVIHFRLIARHRSVSLSVDAAIFPFLPALFYHGTMDTANGITKV